MSANDTSSATSTSSSNRTPSPASPQDEEEDFEQQSDGSAEFVMDSTPRDGAEFDEPQEYPVAVGDRGDDESRPENVKILPCLSKKRAPIKKKKKKRKEKEDHDDDNDDSDFDRDSESQEHDDDDEDDEDDEEYDEDAWKSMVIARVSLYSLAGAVQAVLLQTKRGQQSGSAHGSLDSSAKQKILDHWIMIEQPMGYVTRISGIHSKVGSPCLLHSIKLEFASGQVIEAQGEQDGWKGDAFLAEIEENFYVSGLVFDKGVCIGYKGYSTEKPLAEIMDDESQADPEVLDELQGDSDDEQDFDSGDPNNPNKNVFDPNNPDNASVSDNQANGDGGGDPWITSSLPAKEIPYPDSRADMLLAYICLCGDQYALQGVIFQYFNGKRHGALLGNKTKKPVDVTKNKALKIIESKPQGGQFVYVNHPEGFIRRISGCTLILNNEKAKSNYLCHSLRLEMTSGQVIEFLGGYAEFAEETDYTTPQNGASIRRGKYFEYDIPSDFYITELKFGKTCNGDGRLIGVVGVRDQVEPDATDLIRPDPPQAKKGCCSCFGK